MMSATPDGVKVEVGDLSAYEQERLETMRQNHSKLVELGLEQESTELREATEAKRAATATEKKERQKRFPAPPTRASKRIREEKPQYTGVKIDKFGDEIDAKIERQSRMSHSAEEKAAARSEAMDVARRLVEEARERLRKERTDSKAPKGDKAGWRAEAIRRWGSRAGECDTDDWEGYVASREATPAPTSPEPLLQEHYAEDGWKLLVCCNLMSRVSSHETKTRCIEGFFELCPSPTALLEADAAEVESVIASLGLFDGRWRCLVESSERWLDMPIFDVGMDKHTNKIYGAGQFTVDSYHIFAKDDRTVKPTDAALQSYVRWRDANVE